MPMIHSGASTHHHDHVITPVSLSTMSAGSASLWPEFPDPRSDPRPVEAEREHEAARSTAVPAPTTTTT